MGWVITFLHELEWVVRLAVAAGLLARRKRHLLAGKLLVRNVGEKVRDHIKGAGRPRCLSSDTGFRVLIRRNALFSYFPAPRAVQLQDAIMVFGQGGAVSDADEANAGLLEQLI